MDLTTIFYHIDEYCKLFEKATCKPFLGSGETKRARAACLSISEIITLLVYYHVSGFKTFKDYYMLCHEIKSAFPTRPSYNRFIELQQRAILPIALLAQIYGRYACDGVSYVDSFSLEVSHPRRIHSHKVFKGVAARGKTSVGWFFGFKLHLIVNSQGEVIDFLLTAGNVADNNAHLLTSLVSRIQGKIYADKGYIIKKELFEKLYSQGIHIVTKIRKNMRNILMESTDKLFLAKRGMIESIGSLLKGSYNIEHSRYRNPKTLLLNVYSCIMAYAFRENKPSVREKMCIPA